MGNDNRLQTRLDRDMHDWLKNRAERMHTGSADLQAKTELAMWRSALRLELRRMRLTLAQASCLADILNGTLIDASLGRIVYMEAADAFDIARDTPAPDLSSYAIKWGIDEDALLAWLSRLSPTADHALRDAIAQWWDQECEPTAEGFSKVGLTVVDVAERTSPERSA